MIDATTDWLGASHVPMHLAGALSPAIVNRLYPLRMLTEFHAANHIRGLTGRWMDGGANYLTGVTRGSFHRLNHGHHLFEDGFTVLVNPDLSFGQFLHHLGLDFLTKRGIPNPLLPTALQAPLSELGLSNAFVYELLTVNLSKLLSGSLALVCSGTDVYLALSDALPHTFWAAGAHLLFGAIDVAVGMYPPNAFLLLAGAAEFGVASVTAYRAIVDPVLPFVNLPGSVFFPMLSTSVLVGTLAGAACGYWCGSSWQSATRNAAIGALGAAVSTSVAVAAMGTGFVGPFLGAGAGIATSLIANRLMPFRGGNMHSDNVDCNGLDFPSLGDGLGIPIFGCSPRPIGMLKGDRLLIDTHSLEQYESQLM